jgi:hypothetical protein
MRRLKMLWMPVLLGMLLVAAVVGVASARPAARPLAQPWRVLAVGSQACIPTEDTTNLHHNQNYVECHGGWCWLVCPLDFPAAGEQAVGAVQVKRLTMYVYDYDATGQDTEVVIKKTYPPTGGWVQMAHVATFGSDTNDPQVLMDSTIDNNPVYRTQAPYLHLGIEGSANIRVYGFFVHYTW